ncbi:MAG: putative metal-binding motif-containing protein, partial [Deltaproteobacteria bacterium]|nr:putative metal-binding motif-containing protein [Deltaproteobacteria bacterium]
TSCAGGVVADSCVAGAAAADDANCDGVDNDCNGTTDEGYVSLATTCGTGACAATGATSCTGGVVADSCVAGAAAADDTSCDGIDNDCNGTTDEGYVSVATTCGTGACAATGATSCAGGVVADSCVAGTAAADDTSCDGIDNDCDGAADEDYVVLATTCGSGPCASTGATSCVGGIEADSCSADLTLAAADDANCNAVDDDCDGTVDEDYIETPTACGTTGVCVASGVMACVAGVVTDTCTPNTPAADDSYCDSLDNDCDGVVDEDVALLGDACTGDNPAVCMNGTYACSADGGIVCKFDPLANVDEVCDNLDNDCDGVTDENGAAGSLAWYRDQDSDGFGVNDGSNTVWACRQPTGYVDNNDDCNDTLSFVYPGAEENCDNAIDDDCDGQVDLRVWYADNDADGFGGRFETPIYQCEKPAGAAPDYATNHTDCDDLVASTNPGADDVCNDGVDNDCDGALNEGSDYYPDADGDSFGSTDVTTMINDCVQPDGYVTDNTDCNDADSEVFEGAFEFPRDNIDNDCDGADGDIIIALPQVDSIVYLGSTAGFGINVTYVGGYEGDISLYISEGLDASMETIFTPDSILNAPTDTAAYLVISTDESTPGGLYNIDLLAQTDEFALIKELTLDVQKRGCYVWDDLEADKETSCTDGMDNDCDGYGDVADSDCFAVLDNDGDGYCEDPNYCEGDDVLTGDCDDANKAVNPDIAEICGDEIDNNCDSVTVYTKIWYPDYDKDSFGNKAEGVAIYACEQPDGYVANNGDCDDAISSNYPGAVEVCYDGADNNCNGLVDEADSTCAVDPDVSADPDGGDQDQDQDQDGDLDISNTPDDMTKLQGGGGGGCSCNLDQQDRSENGLLFGLFVILVTLTGIRFLMRHKSAAQ